VAEWGRSRIFASDRWQMTYGERAALEGLAAAAKPKLAIEVGTAQGGSLDCIAEHAEEVHSFDLVEPSDQLPANVTHHRGDSRETLPRVLGEFAEQGRTIEFALVDGDHTAAGVRADLECVLRSPAVDFALVVLHDTMNEEVRSGIRATGLESIPRVVYADLDFVPGYTARGGPFAGQLWGGLGIVIVDSGGERWREGVYEDGHADPHSKLRRGATARRARQRLVERLNRAREADSAGDPA
jgi:hypothetical protein